METFGKFAKAHSTSFRSDEHELPVAISVYYKYKITLYFICEHGCQMYQFWLVL